MTTKTVAQLKTIVEEARRNHGSKSVRWPTRARKARQELIDRTGYAA